MATGIDKKQHKLLIGCLDRLIEKGGHVDEWIECREQLSGAFAELLTAIRIVEESIVNYKNLHAQIRPRASKAYRKRARKS